MVFLVFGVVLILRQSHRGKSLMKRLRSLLPKRFKAQA